MNLLQALAQRAAQERQAIAAGRLGMGDDPNSGLGVNLGNVPVVGGVARYPLAGLHALGLALEGSGTYGKMALGTTAAGLAALRRAQASRYGGAVNALAQTVPVVGAVAQALELGKHLGPLDPLEVGPFKGADADRALDALRAHPGFEGQLAAYAGLEHTNRAAAMGGAAAAEPLNLAGAVAHLPGVLGKVGEAGNLINEVPILPLKALLGAKNAATGGRVAGAGEAVVGGLLGLPGPKVAPVLERKIRGAVGGAVQSALAKMRATPAEDPRFNTASGARAGNTPKGSRRLGPPAQPDMPPTVVRPAPQSMVARLVRAAPQEQVPRLVRKAPQTGIPATLPPEVYTNEPTFRYGPISGLQETAQRLGISQRPSQAPNSIADLLGAARGMGAPEPPPPAPVALARDQIIADTVGARSAQELTPIFRDLHRAIYGDRSRFAIPAMTGVPSREAFTVDTLLAHPDGNAAKEYLDYLATHIQQDAKAQANLAQSNPDLLSDIMGLEPHPKPLETQKRTIQAMFGAGPFKESATPNVAATTPATPNVAAATPDVAGAFDTILASADGGKMSGELPAGTAFWERRLGVGPDEARALLDGAVADGRLGVGPDGALRFKPRALDTVLANPTHDITTPAPLSNVDIAPEGAPRPSTVEPLPPAPAQPSAGELLRRYRERWPEGTPVAPDAVPAVDDTLPASATPQKATPQDILAFQRLNPQERAARTGDVYLDHRLPKQMVGVDRNGNEIYRHPYTPDYFLTSALSGKPIRHYITLPNGARVHPDELSRLRVDTRTGAITDRATGQLIQAGTENLPTDDEIAAAEKALNAIGDRLDRAPTNVGLGRRYEEAQRALFRLRAQRGSSAAVPNTPTGMLAGTPRLEVGGANYTPIADLPLTAKAQEAAPFALQMQYGKLAAPEVARIQQVDAGQGSLFDTAARATPDPLDAKLALRQEFTAGLQDAVTRGADDEARAMLDMAPDYGFTPSEAEQLYQDTIPDGGANLINQQKELIEQSPYFEVFKYFDPKTGNLYMRHATTRKPLTVVENYKTKSLTGKLTASGKYSEVWEIPGSGYDDVAASAMGKVGGYNPRTANDAGDFWRQAREAFQQYRQLQQGKEIPYADFRGGDIAAGGGGGGGLGIASPAINRAGQSLGGAAIGGVAGGVIGGTQGDTPEERTRNAIAGVGAGLLVGGNVGYASPELLNAAKQLGPLTEGTMLSPTMFQRAWRAGDRGQTEAIASKGPRGIGNVLRAGEGSWREQAVMTFKQIPQDALSRWVTLWGLARKELGVTDGDIAFSQEMLAEARDAGTTPLNHPVIDKLRRIGMQRLLVPEEFQKVYGTDFLTSEGAAAASRPRLNARQSSVAGALFSGYNGTPSINPISIAAGAVKGRFQPFITGFVQFANGVQHDAFRYAMADKTLQRDIPALARALTDDLAARGVDVTSLVGKGGYFSGDDVAKVAGPALGKQWDALLENVVRNGGDRVAFLAGDFREASKYKFEDAAGRVFPFIRWPLHYGPVFAEIAAAHPRLAVVGAGILAAQKQAAQEAGLKAYETATTPITTETPVLGAYARLRLGGQKGTVRLNPLGAVVPYSQALGGAAMPEADPDANIYQQLYQKAKAVGEGVGMSPNPLIQGAAYATGLDYQAPGALSRTAGIEGLAGLLPGEAGRLQVPSLRAGLDAVREKVSGQPASDYDPVYRRYAELVRDRTGRVLDDYSNRAYLRADTPEAQALFAQAKREVLLGAAAGNVQSYTSPIAATARGADAQAIAAAMAAVPYSYAMIQAADPGVALRMKEANARYIAQHPEAGAYANAGPRSRVDTLMGDIAAASPLLRYVSPATRRQIQRQQEDEIRRTAPR